MQVAGVYLKSKDQAEAFAKEWSALGPKCVALQADVNDPAEVARIVQDVRRSTAVSTSWSTTRRYNKLVPFQIWRGSPWRRGSTSSAESDLALSMRQSGRADHETAAARPHRQHHLDRRTGAAGQQHRVRGLQGGLIHLTRCLAVALGPEIAVNAVAPGTMMGTRMTSRLDPALVERTTKNAALQKPVERDDVARQVVEFCRSDSTTGQVLVLDSGVVYH